MPDNTPLIKEIDARMAKLSGQFMREAQLQGTHFKYASSKGELIIETYYKRRYFYWLLCEQGFVLVDAADHRKIDRATPIGAALKISVLQIPTT